MSDSDTIMKEYLGIHLEGLKQKDRVLEKEQELYKDELKTCENQLNYIRKSIERCKQELAKFNLDIELKTVQLAKLKELDEKKQEELTECRISVIRITESYNNLCSNPKEKIKCEYSIEYE